MERDARSDKTATTKARASKTKAPKRKKTRAVAVKPVAPLPPVLRRAIFVDVENTSSEESLQKVLEHLKIDRALQPTELTAAGNWRSVGARVARLLAGVGAQLVHSAPSAGVRDWSDLWIAVAAGRWLATAAPGDLLEIVSDDRAFDAVGDAAAAAGVVYKRISYRAIGVGAHPAATHETSTAHRRRRSGRGRRGGASAAEALHPQPAVAHASAGPPPSGAEDEAHAASQEQVRAALARLTGGTPRWILLDTVANALKAEGFIRPPGSPRLVTRLRKMKDVEVSPSGMVRLVGETAVAAEPAASAAAAPPRPRRRRRRRRSTAGEGTAPAIATDAGTGA